MLNKTPLWTTLGFCFPFVAALSCPAFAQELDYPPKLPGGKTVVTLQGPQLLKPYAALPAGVTVAKTAPAVDLLYYPEQNYPGHPWSDWGDSLAANGKYYSSIGDHKAPDGNAYVFEYDPAKKTIRTLVSLQDVLKPEEGHYSPGKIHSRIDLGSDGWLYFSTHRGSTRITADAYHYEGDWILRHHPGENRTEIVCQAPAGKQCIPTSVLDPERLIYYGGTAAADYKDKRVTFFVYDVKARKTLYQCYDGPYRYLIFAKSTGRVYFTPSDDQPLRRYDPEAGGTPVQLDVTLGLRTATQETPQGVVYTCSHDGVLWAFDTQAEKATQLGPAAVGSQTYVASLDADPTGRYLYYVPGAHGGAYRDGTPVVQYDVKTKTRKVLCFLHPALQEKFGFAPIGTYGLAVDPNGERLYITFNGNRGGEDRPGRLPFDTCGLVVVHVPESERQP